MVWRPATRPAWRRRSRPARRPRSLPAASITASASRAPALDGGLGARRQRVGQPEAAAVEADEAAERGQALLVAQPVGLVDRLVDGDHQPVVELQHVDRVPSRPRPGSRCAGRRAGRSGSRGASIRVQSAVQVRRPCSCGCSATAPHQAPGQLARSASPCSKVTVPVLDGGHVAGGLLEQAAPAGRQVGRARRAPRACRRVVVDEVEVGQRARARPCRGRVMP